MKTKSLVLLLGGSSTRSGLDINKTLYKVNDKPLFLYSLAKFYECNFDEYILVVKKEDLNMVKEIIDSTLYDVKIVLGGATRFESVKNGLKEVTSETVYFHDAARPLTSVFDIKELIKVMESSLIGTLSHKVNDTIRYITNNETINRDNLIMVSTPQAFDKSLYQVILNNKDDITDEIKLFEKDYEIKYIQESSTNLKLTTREDLEIIESILSRNTYYIGHSLDYHPFSKEATLLLGGIEFKDYKRLLGHSDADVVFHAIAEAILGAAHLGDLGTFYPDNIQETKGIKSEYILKDVVNKVNNEGYMIHNIDVMIYLLEPNLKDYKKQMALNIAKIVHTSNVCIKAATLNKKGLISLNEGIGCEAVVLLTK